MRSLVRSRARASCEELYAPLSLVTKLRYHRGIFNLALSPRPPASSLSPPKIPLALPPLPPPPGESIKGKSASRLHLPRLRPGLIDSRRVCSRYDSVGEKKPAVRRTRRTLACDAAPRRVETDGEMHFRFLVEERLLRARPAV